MNGCHVKPEQFFNLIFGYNDRYLERVFNLNAVAGNNYLLGTVVPTGEAWIVTALGARDANNNPSVIYLGVYDGTTYYYLDNKASPGANVNVNNANPYILKAGDKVFALLTGCTLNDDLYLEINGYKMKVSQ